MTRIYAMTHKAFQCPGRPVYEPLHVGRAGKQDLGYLGDDTGDSISSKNCFYGELTGMYWLWKNRTWDGNIGICHYRRFFMTEEGKLMPEEAYDRILQEYDIMTSKAIHVEGTYWDYFCESHQEADLKKEAEVIRELYPEDYPVFEQVMKSNKYYFGNLMATRGELFDQYCSWLFPIFFELEKRIDVSSYDAYHQRIYGFLSEQLLQVWIVARGLKVYECAVAIADEKAETRELKLAIGELLKLGQVSEARQLFYEVLKVRPDIRLEHSDIWGDVPILEHVLYIAEVEKQRGMEGVLTNSVSVSELLEHYRKVHEILRKEAWTQQDREYMQKHNVTDIMVEVMVRNQGDLMEHADKILGGLSANRL